MKVLAVFCAVLGVVRGHGAGVWKDPNHYVDDYSLAGLRFISEEPKRKTLNIIGTDDGKAWWHIKGTYGGQYRWDSDIEIDFSPKGGPAGVMAAWKDEEGVGQTITFPDGNVWSLVKEPTPAVGADDGVDDHVGMFRNTVDYKGPNSWKGMRVMVEQPAHKLKIIGSDDGSPFTMWYMEGKCSSREGAPDMSSIDVSFVPKGGPDWSWGLMGKWNKAPERSIVWPDENNWYKMKGQIKREP